MVHTRAAGPTPDDALRIALHTVDRLLPDAIAQLPDAGLRAELEHVVAALAAAHAPAVAGPDDAPDPRGAELDPGQDAGCALPTVRRLERAFALTSFERDVVVLALAPELDHRYGRIFAALHGDRARERPSVGLALALFAPRIGGDYLAALSAIGPSCPLHRLGLVDFRGDGPHAGRELVLRPALWPRLIGQVDPSADRVEPPRDGALAALELAAGDRAQADAAVSWARAHLASEIAIVIRGARGTGRGALAHAIAAELGYATIRAGADADAALDPARARDLAREALWAGAAVVVEGPRAADAGARYAAAVPAPLLIVVDETDTGELAVPEARAVFPIALAALDVTRRAAVWAAALGDHAVASDVDPAALAGQFEVGPGRIAAAISVAASVAAARGTPIRHADLRAACRAAAPAPAFARRLDVEGSLDDVVVPASTRAELDQVIRWARHADKVFRAGAAGAPIAAGGLVTLFVGAPGTGKTLAARRIARTLDRELWRVDLSQVVSKYIGETEKQIDQVFAAAAAADAVVFFDEADALFARRTEVGDAHDRYANLETSFLLQRLEVHRGIVILASNLERNFDPAFLRRIAVIARFPLPAAGERIELWRRHLAPAHLAADVELDQLAAMFGLSGGEIRNAAVAAVLLAAEEMSAVAMRHLVLGGWRELRKAGRLVSAADFGPWGAVVTEHARLSP